MGTKCIFLSYIVFISYINCILIFPSNGTVAPVNVSSPIFEFGPKITNVIIGAIIPIGSSTKELQSCDGINPIYKNALLGNIALVVAANGCSIERHIQVAQNAGARAAIVISTNSWFLSRTRDKHNSKYNLTIPAVLLEPSNAAKYLNPVALSRIVLANFTPTKNELTNINKGGIIFLQIFFIGNLFASFVLCVIRFVQYMLLDTGWVIKIKGFVPLTFAIAEVFIMVVWSDPYCYYLRIVEFPVFYEFVYIGFIFVGTAFSLVCIVLYDLLVKASNKYVFLIPLFLVVLFIITIWAVNLVSIGLSLNWRDFPINPINAGISGTLTFFFFLSSFYVINHFCHGYSMNKNKESMDRYLRLGLSIMSMGFASLFSLILWILGSISSFKANPRIYILILSFAAIGECWAAYSAFFIFYPQEKEKKFSFYAKTNTSNQSANSNSPMSEIKNN
eukprot:TRINITY_DN12186_c0_g1_i1.p1 TRINITY_DN12186_c0_g1~~TRINITY_DN12186_c0_g1_i1.p1  ORF type:complete len:448 (+),score=54.08 TRINITY_DN12186_c0_g1_i1:1-1344(+)